MWVRNRRLPFVVVLVAKEEKKEEKREHWVDLKIKINKQRRITTQTKTTKNSRERLGLRAIRETAAPRSIETRLKHILRRRINYVLWEFVPRRHDPDGKKGSLELPAML